MAWISCFCPLFKEKIKERQLPSLMIQNCFVFTSSSALLHSSNHISP
uniref:Uncharacterized protein n=2 Tax=Anguilla anguilla TaxID=7936 RepID=A0A0E9U4X1_ANGAN